DLPGLLLDAPAQRELARVGLVAPLRDGIPPPANGSRCRATVTSLRSSSVERATRAHPQAAGDRLDLDAVGGRAHVTGPRVGQEDLRLRARRRERHAVGHALAAAREPLRERDLDPLVLGRLDRKDAEGHLTLGGLLEDRRVAARL